jgi:excisionase family DNA binding protein
MKDFMTKEEVSKEMSCHIDTIEKWLRKEVNPLKAYKIGRLIRIKKEDLVTFIEEGNA